MKEVQSCLMTQGGFEKVSLSMGLAVFEELELLSRFSRNGEEFYQRRIATKKLDLMESEVYRKHRMF